MCGHDVGYMYKTRNFLTGEGGTYSLGDVDSAQYGLVIGSNI
jgi:hypothetical protein